MQNLPQAIALGVFVVIGSLAIIQHEGPINDWLYGITEPVLSAWYSAAAKTADQEVSHGVDDDVAAEVLNALDGDWEAANPLIPAVLSVNAADQSAIYFDGGRSVEGRIVILRVTGGTVAELAINSTEFVAYVHPDRMNFSRANRRALRMKRID